MDKAVALTVNVHGVGPELVKYAEPELVGILSHGRYTYKIGLARMLDKLAERKLKATFFWPSSEALRVPGLLERCLKDGHEVASHGRAFEDFTRMPAARIFEVLEEANDTLKKLCGAAPLGFRASGGMSPVLFPMLAKLGYLYDSSSIDDDAPYSLNRPASLGPDLPGVEPASLIELPWAPGLSDATHFSRNIDQDRCEQFMIDALDGLLAEQGWACICLHPRADKGIAREARFPILYRLVERAQAAGAQMITCAAIARRVRTAKGTVIWNGRERA